MSVGDNCSKTALLVKELSVRLSESKGGKVEKTLPSEYGRVSVANNSQNAHNASTLPIKTEYERMRTQQRRSDNKTDSTIDDFYMGQRVSNLRKRFEDSTSGQGPFKVNKKCAPMPTSPKGCGQKGDLQDDDVFEAVAAVPKADLIVQECLSYIGQVHRCLSNLLALKEELDKEFAKDTEIIKSLSNTFRDIQTLKSAYKIIQDTIDKFQSKGEGSFYLYEVLLDPVVCNLMKMYKPFLNNYAANAKWMANFLREQHRRIESCNLLKENGEISDSMNIDQSLYTVFNSLFSLELMLDRYRKTFVQSSDQYRKAEDAKNVISNLLGTMNSNKDQEEFLRTQKELNLLTGRKRESRINAYFILKGVSTIISKRDEKPLSRQLVLFSDCLYVTDLPTSVNGPSIVRQELTTASMEMSEVQKDDSTTTSLLEWGLTISTKWAVQRFYFESEELMETWKEKLKRAVKESGISGDQVDRKPK